MKKLLLAGALIAAAFQPAHAMEVNNLLSMFIETNVRNWSNQAILVDAIEAQNKKTSAYTLAEIEALDQQWRDEVGQRHGAMILPIVENPSSDFLRSQIDTSAGVITEILLMDAKGLNVAVSSPTSDYWQGDEAKYLETYPKGAAALHIGDVEFDESSQQYQFQVSMPVVDADGTVIGAITVGLNAEQFL